MRWPVVILVLGGLMFLGLIVGLVAAFPPTTTTTIIIPDSPTTTVAHHVP